MTKQASFPWHESTFEQKPLIIKAVDYDKHGRPVHDHVLDERPASPGDRFTLIFSNNGKKVLAVDIAVARRSGDPKRPFKTVYAWTGRGLQTGADIGEKLSKNILADDHYESVDEFMGAAIIAGTVLVVPVAVGGTSGFIVGVVQGAADAGKEIRKAIINKEEHIVSLTRYEYDEVDRLAGMRMFASDLRTELARTTYFYKDEEENPYRTVVYSMVENQQYVIEPGD